MWLQEIISIRVTLDYNSTTKKNLPLISFDVLYGINGPLHENPSS